jgi:ADP-heptose:LPS heptosyltransferase
MKILFITLSNIGDVILSLPVLDRLIAVYPRAEITVVCSERAVGIFEDNRYIKRCLAFRKRVSFYDRIRFMLDLRKERYDIAVDLKNSALPLFLKAKYKTYPWLKAPGDILHMSQRHLYKVKKFAVSSEVKDTEALYISEADRLSAADLLRESNASMDDEFALIGPGARSHIKRWPQVKFARLGDRLASELGKKIVLVGDNNDAEVCRSVKSQMHYPAVNLCARTSLKTLAALIEKAQMVISNDSAVMHLSSYLDRPTLAIFGPTDYRRYDPWSAQSETVHSNLDCAPCKAAQCKRAGLNPVRNYNVISKEEAVSNGVKCMNDIEVNEVYEAAKKLL